MVGVHLYRRCAAAAGEASETRESASSGWTGRPHGSDELPAADCCARSAVFRLCGASRGNIADDRRPLHACAFRQRSDLQLWVAGALPLRARRMAVEIIDLWQGTAVAA